MAITTRNANNIIDGAFKLIGSYTADSSLGGPKAEEGLYYLNMIIDHFSSEPELIAYDSILTFPMTPGQREYTISDQVAADVTNKRLVKIKNINLVDGSTQYYVRVEKDNVWYDYYEYDVTKRPDTVFLQNDIGESTLFFLQKPDKAYTCLVKGKFILDQITDPTAPLTNVPIAYHLFLEYALGRELKPRHQGATWDAEAEKRYQETKENLIDTNDFDNELVRDDIFVRQSQVNIKTLSRYR
jgi:hypothetical protein